MTSKSPLLLKLEYTNLQEHIQTDAGAEGGGVSAEGEVPRQREMRCGKARVERKQRIENRKSR